MKPEQSLINKNEKSKELIKEMKADGNIYILSGPSNDQLVEIACKIFEKLNHSTILPRGTRDDIMAGEEVRPQGAFAISLRDSKLYVELRNGTGYKPMMDELKEAVDSI